jgi:HK97 family phage major capsid protein
MRTIEAVRSEIDSLTRKRDELANEADALQDRAEPGHQERRHRLAAGSANVQSQIDALRAEYGQILLAGVESGRFSTETVDDDWNAQRAERGSTGYSIRSQLESRAVRAVERHRNTLSAEAGDRLEAVIRDTHNDPNAVGARYISAVANPAYDRALGRVLADPQHGHLSMDADEVAAWRETNGAMRAMSLTGAAGGFAVPFDLDPTLILTGGGAIHPLRQAATVKTIATDTWQGVSTAGITAAYAAEATATTDNAPTLVQPTVSTEKAQAFVPFSIEIGMDWPSMRQELGAALEDAKATLEATKFTLGTGTNEPFGIITGSTNTVNATAAGVFDSEDLYRLMQTLPPRYQARASFMGNLAILNKISQFESAAGARLFPETADGRLLRRPLYENSAMTAVTTVGALFLLYGDLSRFVIVDRIGMQIELIPHLFDTTNNRPTGQRGLYMYFRNGSKLIDASATVVLIGLA